MCTQLIQPFYVHCHIKIKRTYKILQYIEYISLSSWSWHLTSYYPVFHFQIKDTRFPWLGAEPHHRKQTATQSSVPEFRDPAGYTSPGDSSPEVSTQVLWPGVRRIESEFSTTSTNRECVPDNGQCLQAITNLLLWPSYASQKATSAAQGRAGQAMASYDVALQ